MKKLIAILLAGTMLSTATISTSAYANGDTFITEGEILIDNSNVNIFFNLSENFQDWADDLTNILNNIDWGENNNINQIFVNNNNNNEPDEPAPPPTPVVSTIFNEIHFSKLTEAHKSLNDDEFIMTYLDTKSYIYGDEQKNKYNVHKIVYNYDGTYVNTDIVSGESVNGTWSTDEDENIILSPDGGNKFKINVGGESTNQTNFTLEDEDQTYNTTVFASALDGFTTNPADEQVVSHTVDGAEYTIDIDSPVEWLPVAQGAINEEFVTQFGVFTKTVTTYKEVTTHYAIQVNGPDDGLVAQAPTTETVVVKVLTFNHEDNRQVANPNYLSIENDIADEHVIKYVQEAAPVTTVTKEALTPNPIVNGPVTEPNVEQSTPISVTTTVTKDLTTAYDVKINGYPDSPALQPQADSVETITVSEVNTTELEWNTVPNPAYDPEVDEYIATTTVTYEYTDLPNTFEWNPIVPAGPDQATVKQTGTEIHPEGVVEVTTVSYTIQVNGLPDGLPEKEDVVTKVTLENNIVKQVASQIVPNPNFGNPADEYVAVESETGPILAEATSTITWNAVVNGPANEEFVTQTGFEYFTQERSKDVTTTYNIQVNGNVDIPPLPAKASVTMNVPLAAQAWSESVTQEVPNPAYDSAPDTYIEDVTVETIEDWKIVGGPITWDAVPDGPADQQYVTRTGTKTNTQAVKQVTTTVYTIQINGLEDVPALPAKPTLVEEVDLDPIVTENVPVTEQVTNPVWLAAPDEYVETDSVETLPGEKTFVNTDWDEIVPEASSVTQVSQTGTNYYVTNQIVHTTTTYTIKINGAEDNPALEPKDPVTVTTYEADVVSTEPTFRIVANPAYVSHIVEADIGYLGNFNLAESNRPNKNSTTIHDAWKASSGSNLGQGTKFNKLNVKGLQEAHNQGYDGAGKTIFVNGQTDAQRTHAINTVKAVAPGATTDYIVNNSHGFSSATIVNNVQRNVSLNTFSDTFDHANPHLMGDKDTLQVFATRTGAATVLVAGATSTLVVGNAGQDNKVSVGQAEHFLVADNNSISGGTWNEAAAAKVAGAGAILLQKFKNLDAKKVKTLLLETADSSFDGYSLTKHGQGELDLNSALSPTAAFDEGNWGDWEITEQSFENVYDGEFVYGPWSALETVSYHDAGIYGVKNEYLNKYGTEVTLETRNCIAGKCVGNNNRTYKQDNQFIETVSTPDWQAETKVNPIYSPFAVDITGYDYTHGTAHNSNSVGDINNTLSSNFGTGTIYGNVNVDGLQAAHNEGWDGTGVNILINTTSDASYVKKSAYRTLVATAPGANIQEHNGGNSGIFVADVPGASGVVLQSYHGIYNEYTDDIQNGANGDFLSVFPYQTNSGADAVINAEQDKSIAVGQSHVNYNLSDNHAKHWITADATNMSNSSQNSVQYSAAKVAGAAAIAMHKFTNLDASETKHLLLNTADRTFDGYNSNDHGMGRLDVGAMLSPAGVIQ